MFNSITSLINRVHNIGKESTHLVVPTYKTPARPATPTKPARPVSNEESVTYTYIKIVVNGQELTGQAAIDFMNSK